MPAVTIVGSYNHDLFLTTDRLPAAGETRMGSVSEAHGGKGFNQAVACRRLGADTLFVGALGDDAAADGARRYARSQGLTCIWLPSTQPTGRAVIIRDAHGQNQIVVAAGANLSLDVQAVDSVAAQIASSRILLVQLECPPDSVLHAMKVARSAGVVTILNPAPAPPDLDPALLELADILTPNESEFESLCDAMGSPLPTGWLELPDPALHDACRKLCTGTVVITMGEHGGFYSCSDGRYDRYTTPSVRAVDSTGAGDCFNGALAASLAEGCALDASLGRSAAAAALSVTRAGAAPAMPDRVEAGWPPAD